jgi:hypothetical protein
MTTKKFTRLTQRVIHFIADDGSNGQKTSVLAQTTGFVLSGPSVNQLMEQHS